MTQTTAKLIMDGTGFIAVYTLAEQLGTALSAITGTGFEMKDPALTSVRVVSGAYDARIAVGFEGEEKVTSVGIDGSGCRDEAAAQALLARLVFTLAAALPVDAVIWPGTTVRIPRQTFVTELGAALMPPGEDPAPITPRRVRCATSGKPRSGRGPVHIDRRKAPRASLPRDVGGNIIGIPTTMYSDAHMSICDADLLCGAHKGTLAGLTAQTRANITPAPLFLHHPVKGEGFRLASLAITAGGLFTTLGAMSTLPML
ncbi:hypothetical protein ACN2XU_20555 [Primorskyibacter sp. 2E107]|uniref:hypothetical protein n=1 Tax=Primorskyibacter sp. 2E107 TaxID=3403458 RepID=UPI003AF680B4